MPDIEVPVLIVGGGGCGLASLLFLSRQGIRNMVVERHPAPGRMPKARYISQRTMELLRQFEVTIPRQSRGLSNVSRSKRLNGGR